MAGTIKYNWIYNNDARQLNEIIAEKIVDVTITSPPYFDLKDYGYKQQIGYGQKYDEYLKDLKIVFKNVFDCTKDNGTLWVIIDSFRKENEVTPLPFDFSNALKDIGWKLQEVIIWVKDKTVPWAHQGQMRNLFEYILLFSKENKYNFFIDEVRDFESLKKWWVKYPERYNPKGKIPDGLWHFDIPTQGSWGNGYIKHFCPLPEELIAQILKIATKEGDLVLDPFAGSGAVLAKASNMDRNYLGFELNKKYIQMFEKYLEKSGKQKKARYTRQKISEISQSQFTTLILNLRVLKYAKTILKKLPPSISGGIERMYVKKLTKKVKQKNGQCVSSFTFYLNSGFSQTALLKELQEICSKPPLSKFGIEAEFYFEKKFEDFLKHIKNTKKLFSYTKIITYRFNKTIKFNEIRGLPASDAILSNIKVELNEKDYE